MTITRREAMAAGAAIVALSASAGRAQAGQDEGARDAEMNEGDEPIDLMPAITAYIAGAKTASVPEAIRERARLHILDTLVSIIACRNLEPAQLGRRYATARGGSGTAILGSRQSASLVDAVFASAMTGHAAEINDFIPSAYVQPGPSIVSAALSLGQQRGASGRELVHAVVAGYELAGRIPKTIGTPPLWRAGIANHGIAPVFGTATASAAILGFDAEQANHMLAYCAQQASGSWQWLLDVRHVEKAFVFAGMGARNGLDAALMVEAGFSGVPDCLDVEGGWLRSPAFEGGADRSYLIEGLGERYELELTAFKRYPSGGPTQPAVQAMLEMREEVEPGDVETIRIAMPGGADTFRGARMPALNLPYLASIIMLDGELDFVAAQSLDRMHNDAEVAAFAEKVSVVRDEAQETGEGEDRTESARVTITRTDGATVERYVPYVRGFPSHPMTRADVEEKARGLAEPVLGTAGMEELIARTAAIEEETALDPIVALMTVDTV